jgi:hypothetical protein
MDGQGSNIIARLQPLSGGTILQKFGYETPIIKLALILVGDTDRDALEVCATSQSTFTLVYNGGTVGTYSVKSFGWSKRAGVVCQTLRGDLAVDSPVYECELELYE